MKEFHKKLILFIVTIWEALILSALVADIIRELLGFQNSNDLLSILFMSSLFLFSFLMKYIDPDFKKESTPDKGLVISLICFRRIKRDNHEIRIILFLGAIIFLALEWKFPQINLSTIPSLLFICIILLIAKEQLMKYRIRKGIFGTNRTEAKALIEFIIKNSDDIDFTDSNGNLRRALMPETEPTSAEQPLPAFGEEAPA